ncbi:MAG TPA: hypothetical protein VJV78_12775 [Polyangiales bacterium]|nr:hypothetical protein [Polyangiales bacterium]
MSRRAQPEMYEVVSIGLIAGSMLMHEILLTRICALRLHFHFAYLVISNCLLALGAGGSLLALRQARWREAPRLWLGRFSAAYLVALICTYFALQQWPLPKELVLGDPLHLSSLLAFNLVGALPFGFAGIAIGMLLTFRVEHASRLYAVDLAAAAVGCFACPLLLRLFGAGGVFVCVVLLALLACAVIWPLTRVQLWAAAGLGASLLALVPHFDALVPIPSKGSGLRELTGGQSGQQILRAWTSNSRVDVEVAPPGFPAFIFMSGSNPSPIAPPSRWAHIAQDASAGTAIIDYSNDPNGLEPLKRSMYAASYRLMPRPRVLVIGLGGGNDVWAARAYGARSVRAIELNAPVIDVHRRLLRDYSRALLEDPGVEFVLGEGRSELMRDPRQYDVVQMSGIDTWTALASGAYVLAENYLYTREAIASMYQHLAPGGILQIARFAASMEAIRLVSNISSALEDFGVHDVEHSIIALATQDRMLALLLKKGRFSAADEASTRQFAALGGIRIEYLPSRPVPTMLDKFVRSPDKPSIIRDFKYNIEPTSDDRPYFFNFARWQRPLAAFDKVADIPAVSQGNPFFILTQLLVSVLLSAGLILLPLRAARPAAGPGRTAFLGYFCALGMGFILIEIAVMQKLTLFLGQPVYSLTVSLFSLLVFTGMGSLLLAERAGQRSLWLWPLGIALYIAAWNALSAPLFASFMGAALGVRIALAVLFLAPLGMLLGVPFAYGLRLASERDPWLGPWAWGINGCSSVVGSILSVVLSMNFGFRVVLWSAAAIYVAGFAALWFALGGGKQPTPGTNRPTRAA